MNYKFFSDPELAYISWPIACASTNGTFARCYANALMSEMVQFSKKNCRRPDLEALYISGLALNCVPEDIILDMSGTLKRTFDLSNLLQGTIEVDQGFLNVRQARCWREAGINRLVIGIYHYMQSEIPIGSMRDFFPIIALAFTICITPETVAGWKAYIKKIIVQPIKQISISFVPTTYTDLRIDFYYWLRAFLLGNGMQQYELYSFEIPEYGSVYMKGYLNRKTLKGFGAGAESFNGHTRCRNDGNLSAYIKKSCANKAVMRSTEVLSKQDIRVEKIMLGLRTQKGVSCEVLYAHCSQAEYTRLKQELLVLKWNGLIVESDNMIALTPVGLGYEQEVLLKLVV